MGSLLSYSGLTTKIRAMQSRLLTTISTGTGRTQKRSPGSYLSETALMKRSGLSLRRGSAP
ncbi:MAG: hypothetical protein ACLTA7_04550 [Ruminococcus sp.]